MKMLGVETDFLQSEQKNDTSTSTTRSLLFSGRGFVGDGDWS
jgi:hypothetical protein